jgi:hypothetical protein
MSAHAFGALALLGSAALVTLAAGVALFGLARGDRKLGRRAGLLAVAWAVLYGAAVLASPATTQPRVLLPGEEISLCGLDCHLHVSVAGTNDTTAPPMPGTHTVHVRARSDAKRAPEFPAELRFRLVDAENQEYVPEPESGQFAGPLAAGDSDTITLVFAPPPTARNLRLRVTRGAWPDRLLLGPANTRAVARTTLALGTTTP